MLGNRRVSASRSVALAFLMASATSCGTDEARRADTSGPASSNESRAVRAERGAQRCDSPNASMLVDSIGIGPVLRGARIADVRERCSVADTSVILAEGEPERAHRIVVRGKPLIALSTGTADTSIIRVITQDAAFKTSGGVGVGSSVESLRLAHGRICAARGEGIFVVMAADLPGVSFAIDWNPPPSRDLSAADTPFPGGDPGTALDATRITKLWVHGVSGACRVSVS